MGENAANPFPSLAKLLSGLGEQGRVWGGNSLEVVTSGLRKRELLLKDLAAARSFIHIEYFRFGNDSAGREVRDILVKKASEGVQVRLLNNNWSGLFTIPRSYFSRMAAAGVEVIPFTHIRHGVRKWLYRINHQQHRKILVIDGQVAYTGGMNLNDNYFYRWRDTHLRITGPVVAAYNASFMQSWRESGGRYCYPPEAYFPPVKAEEDAPFRGQKVQLVTSDPSRGQSVMLDAFCRVLAQAADYVYLCTPYFVPPQQLLEAIRAAAGRGVDVRLMLPGKVDTPFLGPANRSFYADCLEAGVRVYERGGSFVHSKTLVADDSLVCIGSTNLDSRSFHLNYEADTFLWDSGLARHQREDFLSNAGEAREWDLPSWKRWWRGPRKAFGAFLRLLRRQL